MTKRIHIRITNLLLCLIGSHLQSAKRHNNDVLNALLKVPVGFVLSHSLPEGLLICSQSIFTRGLSTCHRARAGFRSSRNLSSTATSLHNQPFHGQNEQVQC